MPSSQMGSAGAPFAAYQVSEKAADYVALPADFRGGILISMNVATPCTFTVNAGVKATRPVSIINHGAGLCTVVAGAGVTINAPAAAMRLTEQYSMATLIPDPDRGDTFWLAGALS